MMDEICSHIMDIAVNSVTAHATVVRISIIEDRDTQTLTLTIADNGKGMDTALAQRIQDPFFTTKTGKSVGLGIALLRGTAETTGGTFLLKSAPGEGTFIKAQFGLEHPDRPPVGNLKDTILVLVAGNPTVDFIFQIQIAGTDFTLDTKEMKTVLDGLPINHPEVVNFLTNYLDEHVSFR